MKAKDFHKVPPSGGSLEIGNVDRISDMFNLPLQGVPPSGGSLEIGNINFTFVNGSRGSSNRSPFGGIPRNWKHKSAKEDKGIHL